MENNLHNFLQYIFEIVEGMDRRTVSADTQICDGCGLTYGNFKQAGKLGCEICYTAFRTHIAHALKNIHGSAEHRGKIPAGQSVKLSDILAKRELDETRRLLKKAVEAEEFEQAVKYRDQINALQSKLDNEKDARGDL